MTPATSSYGSRRSTPNSSRSRSSSSRPSRPGRTIPLPSSSVSTPRSRPLRARKERHADGLHSPDAVGTDGVAHFHVRHCAVHLRGGCRVAAGLGGNLAGGAMITQLAGPAIPPPIGTLNQDEQLTLRDYFAAQALIGIMLGLTAKDRARYRSGHASGQEAAVAYAIADAMLAERAL